MRRNRWAGDFPTLPFFRVRRFDAAGVEVPVRRDPPVHPGWLRPR